MELEIIRFVQSFSNPLLDLLFQAVTILAEPLVQMFVIAWIYWNGNKEQGRAFCYASFVSVVLNGGVKDIFRLERPIGQEGVRTLRAHTATGYSFPSGHSQAAACTACSLAQFRPGMKHWALAIGYMLLVGLSRIYLGVHYPKDVLVGLLLGSTVSFLGLLLYHSFTNRNVLFLGTLAVLLPFCLTSDSPDFYKGLGIYLGFMAGSFLEERWVGFPHRDALRSKVRRMAAGVLCLLAVYLGLKHLCPAGLLWDLLRYAGLSFAGIGLCPMLFKLLRI